MTSLLPEPYALLARLGTYAAVAATLYVCGHVSGANHVRDQWDLQEARRGAQVAVIEKKAAAVSVEVVDRHAAAVRLQADARAAIAVEINRLVPDDGSHSPPDFVRLWNAANRGLPVSDAPPGSADAAQGVGWHAVASQHADEANYCRQTEIQLTSLQDWVRRQQSIASP